MGISTKQIRDAINSNPNRTFLPPTKANGMRYGISFADTRPGTGNAIWFETRQELLDHLEGTNRVALKTSNSKVYNL